MRDSMRRFNKQRRDGDIAPVITYNAARFKHLVAPVGEQRTQRPMGLREIKKKDSKGIRFDGKEFSVQSEPKIKTWWAYLSADKTTDRMSRVEV